jgi:hypothetical protein
MATYAEFLKSQGATDEDIKILDTPVAQRAFAKMEAAAADEKNARLAAEKKTAAYQTWYERDALPYVTETEYKLKATEATLVGERARIKALQDAGLLEIASQDEAAKAAAAAAAAAGQPMFDASKYVPREQFNELAIRAADSITLVADLAQEHSSLGLPPVSWRVLKNEAAAVNQDVETYWKTKFNVEAKRSERAATEQAARDKKIADDAIAGWKAAHPQSAVNPALGYGVPSSTPFTGKVPSASDATQPWLRSDSERVNTRITKVLQAHPDLVS